VSEYVDPDSGNVFEYGVQLFNDYGPARAFFERLGITPTAPARLPLTQQFVDFTTGRGVNYTVPSLADTTAALKKFLEVVEPFENYLLPGYWNFPQPSAIPADLLLPFRRFVEKYNIQAAVLQIFETTGFGAGNWDTALTMYLLSAFGPPMIRFLLGNGALFTPSSRRNSEVYESIQYRLRDEVLYNSTVTQSDRALDGHTLWVRDHNKGSCTIVHAKKLLIAIEPTDANMAPFAVDNREQKVFSKLRFQNVQVGIVSHPSLPTGVSLVNTPAAAAGGNYLALPKLNFNIRYDHLGQNSTNFRVMVVGESSMSKSDAQKVVTAGFDVLVAAGTVPPKANGSGNLKFKVWSNHGHMHGHASAEEIRGGFIQKQYALQGHKGTWWTGGAFSHQFQTILWAFDDILLSKMFA